MIIIFPLFLHTGKSYHNGQLAEKIECLLQDCGQPGHSGWGAAGFYRSAYVLPNGHVPFGEQYTDHLALLPLQLR